MSNSPLVAYTLLSPNHSGKRTHAIDRITPHCVVGQLSAESICGCFKSTSRQASCNYGIGYDGKVSLCVDEGNRSWCTSSNANDQRAVTIEVASGSKEPYEITAAAYESLIALMTDICKRNGKTKLLWFADKDKTLAYNPAANEMVITVHRWFANKSCPGTYIYERLGKITEEVNKRLGGGASAGTGGTAIMGNAVLGADQLAAFLLTKNSAPKLNGVDAAKLAQLYISEGKTEGVRGDLAFCQSCLETGYWTFTGDVKPEQNNFAGIGATGGGAAGASFPDAQTGIRAQIQHLKAYASKDALKNQCVDPRYSLVTKGSATTVEALSGRWAADTGYGAKITTIYAEAAAYKKPAAGNTDGNKTSFPAVPFTVQVIVPDLNYRSEPSMSGKVNGQTGKGTFTITQVKDGWGKLKSGAGWIYLENPDYCTIGKTVQEAAPTPAKKVPYTVKVSIADLNIRKGPGTNYAKTGQYTGKGVFTIVEEQPGIGSDKGWGRLKSGAGWISLDFCQKA